MTLSAQFQCSMADMLNQHASRRPDAIAYIYLDDSLNQTKRLTFCALQKEINTIAHELHKFASPGERALLLYPSGLEFISAFLACLQAGIIAVPVHAPRSTRHRDRLDTIVRDCQPSIVMTSQHFFAQASGVFPAEAGTLGLPHLFTDEIALSSASEDHRVLVSGEETAFLQYTSGSTTSPRGVMVTHSNIAANERIIKEAFRANQDSVVVSWLPHYHDMGLIGGILHPLWVGAQCILMSPQAFLRRPKSWLQAISDYRATISGGPNFAYELCSSRILEEEKQTLDLSPWTVAFNGAEPVRLATVERFCGAFQASGFRKNAIAPCYGLAEATLLVSAKHEGSEYTVHNAPATGSNSDSVQDADNPSKRKRLVGCGEIGVELSVQIVDPQTRMDLPDGVVGEIVVSGPTIAAGYWKNEEASLETFHTGEANSPLLSTGDLGFRIAKELVVTGRLKDLLIVRGKNYHAEDIEVAAASVHESLRTSPGAAFSVETEKHSEAILIQELPRRLNGMESLSRLVEDIRRAVAEEEELILDRVVLVATGAIPRTTSGKVRRQACRSLYLEGRLDVLFSHVMPETSEEFPTIALEVDRETTVLEKLQHLAAHILQVDPRAIRTDLSLLSLGLDSLTAVTLHAKAAESLGIHISLEKMLRGTSLRELAAGASTTSDPPAESHVVTSPEGLGSYPLSEGQKALFYIHLLDPQSPAYNLFSASRTDSPLDISAFCGAIRELINRHSLLRSLIISTPDGPMRSVVEDYPSPPTVQDASQWNEETLENYLKEAANRPFEISKNPPFRVELIRQEGRGDIVLLVAHHIMLDLWSASILLDELADIYTAILENSPLPSRLPHIPYSQFVDRQLLELKTEKLKAQKTYWRGRLTEANTSLALPADRSPALSARRGSTLWFELDDTIAAQVGRQAQVLGVSLNTFLLAAFSALLLRISAQDDVLVGAPVSGRTFSSCAACIGYFINQVVLRSQWFPGMRFAQFATTMQTEVAAALSNQDYPFSHLVEDLEIRREAHRTPLTQVMFGLQSTRNMTGTELSRFILGHRGAEFRKGALKLQAIPVENLGAQCDLSLFFADQQQRLSGLIQYDSDIFDRASIDRIKREFEVLLDAVSQDPDLELEHLPIMDKDQSERMLIAWNATLSPYVPEMCVHHLVEQTANTHPDLTAVSAHDGTLEYRQLISRSVVIAATLQANGVIEDSIVALQCSRSVHLPVAMLGILQAGAAFLPLDLSLPVDRLRYMVQQSHVQIAVTDDAGAAETLTAIGIPQVVRVDLLTHNMPSVSKAEDWKIPPANPDALAYVIFTSGSTGVPKGVVVTHRNLGNFCHAMTHIINCGAGDRFYALTSISFDISILELLWPLTCGAEVAIIPEQKKRVRSLLSTGVQANRGLDFSLFYFADASNRSLHAPYTLLIQGAKFADEHGFTAVWTPERHFHQFGGLYPNPSVTSAALAAVTERIRIRAGSVVLPLHNPIRIAEEWSVVDNLSQGRVDIAFASGWHANDFVLAPGNFEERRRLMEDGISTIQQLWRGHPIEERNGIGDTISVEIFPKPVQPELPIWITAAGTPATFQLAGALGANVLTHLLGQGIDDVQENVKNYRRARANAGLNPDQGRVTLMLHTFLGSNREEVQAIVREPFKQYLRSSVGLIEKFIKTMGLPVDFAQLTSADFEALLDFAAQRYAANNALFGTVSDAASLVENFKEVGVNEIACLIDFGIESGTVINSLSSVRDLMTHLNLPSLPITQSRPKEASRRHLLQCTPSMMKLLLAEKDEASLLHSIDTLLLGGEPVSASLVERIKAEYSCKVMNMYGPTETTIWSTSQELDVAAGVTVGRPISNTECFILDRRRMPVDVNMVGELYIGGDGVARGYIGQRDLTEERFIPNPIPGSRSGRLYRTGDLARFKQDGAIEVLGRIDQQVKIRGHRVELPEIEFAIGQHPDISNVAVVKSSGDFGDGQESLVAYFVPKHGSTVNRETMRLFLGSSLPSYMIPSHFVSMDALPLLPSGKTDRKALEQRPILPAQAAGSSTALPASVENLEQVIEKIWMDTLHIDRVSLDDNFFDIGGHSLLMVQVHNALSAALRGNFPLIKLLESPTIRSLAAALTEHQASSRTSAAQSSEIDRAAMQRKGLAAMRRNASSTRPVA